MSDNDKVRRKYQRISAEHLAYAKRRFQEFASTSAVRAELKAQGGEYSHSQLHYWWVKANPPTLKDAVSAEIVAGIGKSLREAEAELLADADADHGPDEANPPKSQAA